MNPSTCFFILEIISTILSSSTCHWRSVLLLQVRKRAKIRNRYNKVPHLTKDTNGKVTIRYHNQSQEVSPFTSDDHKTSINRSALKQNTNKSNTIYDPQMKHRLGTVSKYILHEGLNRLHGAPNSPLVPMWIKTHRCLVA